MINLYVVSDPDPGVGYETQGTMDVNFTANETTGFVALGLPDETGGVFIYHTAICIPRYNIIVKYESKGYAY